MIQNDRSTEAVLICIAGPTAVGKSGLALALAKKRGCCIVSADSMQIYKGMDIGTAKPSKEEQAQVKHYMIDIVEPTDEYNAFLYAREADKILKDNPEAIAVGGTGLYFESLIFGLDYPTGGDVSEYRKELWDYCEKNGKEALHRLLTEKDAATAAKIHPNNVKSVIRALEILSKNEIKPKRERTPQRDYVLFALSCDRALLYERINKRVDLMIEKGLIDETEYLLEKYGTKSQVFQAIGYKEIISYLKGKSTLYEATELIKQHTRNYAKRQITFLKRLNPVWLDAAKEKDDLIEEIEHYLQNSSTDRNLSLK